MSMTFTPILHLYPSYLSQKVEQSMHLNQENLLRAISNSRQMTIYFVTITFTTFARIR